MTADTIKRSFMTSLPVMAGYLIIGFGFGILLRDAGYGVWWAFAMSLFIYAGSMQLVGISLITAPASILTTAVTTVMINARHLFYSISMIGRYRDAGKMKPYLIFALTDETYALLSSDEGKRGDLFCFLVSLFNHSYWIIGTVAGSLIASSLPFGTTGIDFSMTALFTAAFTEQWTGGGNRKAALTGLLATLAARLIFGRDLFLIPSMIIITAILLMFRKRIEGKEAIDG